MDTAKLLLHPVRLQIVKAFVGGDRRLTTRQIASEVPGIPEASVYRHVARLASAGVLEVVAECRVRGAVERTYALRPAAARIRPEDAAAMSLDEHAQAFLAYVAGLLADFDRYLGGTPGPGRDAASYRVAGMWLSDEELGQFARELAALIAPRLATEPAPGRHRWLLYTVALPTPRPGDDGADVGNH